MFRRRLFQIPEPWEVFLFYCNLGMGLTLFFTRNIWRGGEIWDGLGIALLSFVLSGVVAKIWMEWEW